MPVEGHLLLSLDNCTAMGNHLVAKLAFFPPDPAKYGKDGLAFSFPTH